MSFGWLTDQFLVLEVGRFSGILLQRNSSSHSREGSRVREGMLREEVGLFFAYAI